MRRGLLVVALGLAFLIAITWLGTFIGDYTPQKITPQIQVASTGPYDVTLRVDPNPPALEQPATFSIQIHRHSSHQPLSNAHVALSGTMADMGMSTAEIQATARGEGTYVASVLLNTSGLWQLQVLISAPGQPALNATFAVMTR